MAKLLNTTFLVTQSAPATPSSDFGTLFASSSKLFFKNTLGTTYDLTAAGGSGGGNINILTYTSPGNYTPTTGVQYIKVICAGGGGGGGSGRVAATNSTTAGGQGGGGGHINIAYFSSSVLLGNTYSVNIGVGGPGGTRRTSNGLLNGVTGTTGLSSSFGTGSGASFTRLLSALGGRGGGGGGVGAFSQVAPTTTQVPNPYPPFYFVGVEGGVDINGPQNASNAFSPPRWLAGGGCGGRIFLNDVSSSGASGSAIFSYTTLIQSGSPSAAASGLPGNNGAAVIDVAHLLFYSGSNITTGVRVGTGGHGGGSGNRGVTPLVNGGDGGSGSLAAGGGGGGGAALGLNTVFSGAGGLGGDGFVIIFEYF